jgi:HEAT repeat protein
MKRTPRAPLALVVLCALAAGPAHGQAFLGKSAREWSAGLDNRDASVRRSSAFALGKMGAGGSGAVDGLVRRLSSDQDAGVREAAAAALGDVAAALRGGGRGLWDDAGPALRKALTEDGDPRVRRSAAYALGCFGDGAGGAAAALKKALHDESPSVRRNAAWAVGKLGLAADGAAVTDLCDLLTDPALEVRRDAAGALGTLGRPKGLAGAAPLLRLAKEEKEPVVLKTALDALAKLAGPEHRDGVSVLSRLLSNDDPEVARAAAFVMGNVGGEPAVAALPVLRQALRDDDPLIQGLAAAALAGIGPEAAPAVLDLAAALTDGRDGVVRRNAAIALGHLKEKAKPAVPAIVKALRPTTPTDVRQYAAEALAHMRYPANEEAIPAALEAIRKDPDSTVRQRCVWALFNLRDLERFGADKALAEVLETKDEAGVMVRYDSARCLAFAMGARAPARTADVLLHMLRNKELLVYNRTDAKVEGSGSEATRGQSGVAQSLGGDARFMAAEALGWLKERAAKREDVLKALREATTDKDKTLREKATQALKDLGAG